MMAARLPDRPTRLALASGEYPELISSLRSYGLEVITTEPDRRLPKAVCWHPDMQACPLEGELFVLQGSELMAAVAAYGVAVSETAAIPAGKYPGDVLCNGLAWDNYFMANQATVDETILAKVRKLELQLIHVRQGYAACSTALVNAGSAITADSGTAAALEANGIEVLLVEPGHIILPGYSYGLFGGCCGKLGPELMGFAGRLDSHPNGGMIRQFLEHHGVEPLELIDGPLMDVGGIMSLA